MHEETKNVLSTIIKDNLKAIKDPRAKLAALADPDMIERLLYENQIGIEKEVKKIQEVLIELKPFLENIKSKIDDIAQQNHLIAIYLLLSSIFYEWDSLLILAKSGKYSSAYTILRKINEAIDQVTLFTHDYSDKEDKNIKDWFSGNIIGNELSRKRMESEVGTLSDIDVKSLLSHLYQVESNPSHNGYASLLELVSPFTEDFDYRGPTGFHRTLRLLNSPYPINSLIQSLRLFYLLVLPDREFESSLEKISNNWHPNSGARDSSDSVKTKFPKKEK